MRRSLGSTLGVAIAALAIASTASLAQTAARRVVDDPPLLETARRAGPQPMLLGAPAGASVGEAVLDLDVRYTDGTIWNPATGRFDAVRLRSYQGTGVDPDAPFVSPMISIYPGETVRMTLNNRLPPDPGCTAHGDVNTPHCFNGTNLHTHGLWVNPAGNGDNVLISINPGVSFQYEYKIPPDHPAGTFWYHTHRHGSTALQVSSGMAGALLIRGARVPTATETGDIDTLLRPTPAQPFRERVVVMQQIQYACRDRENKIKTNPDGTYLCEAGDVGGIESYDQFGPGSWPKSGRHTSINGHVLPWFGGAKSGEIERWRMIHGGVRDTISLEFRKLEPGAAVPATLAAAQHDAWVGANCSGTPLPQHLIAADGLTLAAAKKASLTVFQPAYRWDALMVFPEPGIWCVVDAAAPAPANVGNLASSRQLLGFVEVEKGTVVDADPTEYLTAQLVAAAARNIPEPARAKVIGDLGNGLKLSSFVPHPDVAPGEVTGTQELAFNIDVKATPIQFQVDGKPYDPARMDRTLRLGGVDEWTLRSDFVSHPFHIHVNPFQVVRILDPSGRDVSAADAIDGSDPQYPGLKGVWKDTVWIKNTGSGTQGQYTVVVRTRYQRYIGDFVLHCHILDHEDQGMMQNVRIALPDGSGGVSHGH
jgi:FtsP/CotA-like multicopper oxidase with cupredoxin domain